ncbi:sugar ABC transporter [Psychromonas sp.]|nr:sugar ABC transporter [Psychromonas sp.]
MIPKWLLICLLLISFNTYSQSILVVDSYHSTYPWSISYKEGLEKILGSKYELTYIEMNTKHIPKSQYQAKADLVWEKYQALSPALVIIGDDNALETLAPRFLKTNTPVVYLGINANPRKYGIENAPNFSGVLERPLIKRSLIMLQQFVDVKKILILFDTSDTGEVILQDVFYGKTSMSIGKIHLDIRKIGLFNQWKQAVLNAKKEGYDVIIPALYQTLKDEDGEHVDAEEIIKWTAENTELPPFGFWDYTVASNKNIGGYVVSGYHEGIIAGKRALEILRGRQINARVFSSSKGYFIFSQSQLKKWNITLPDKISNEAIFIE